MEHELADEILRCWRFFQQNETQSLEKIHSAFTYQSLKDDLSEKFILFAKMVATKYDGWIPDSGSPGYLVKRSSSNFVRFPYYLATIAPRQSEIDAIWAISRLIKTDNASAICLSGSTVSLSAIPNFADIDFCEYVYLHEGEEDIRIKVNAKTEHSAGRYFRKLKVGRKKYFPENISNMLLDLEPILPNSDDFSTGMIDYIVDLEPNSDIQKIRVCDVSNKMIYCNPDGTSSGRKQTFAHQEVVLDELIEPPSNLADPFELGRYVNFLIDQTEGYLESGNPQKACKRALSLSRVCHLSKFSDEISNLAKSNFSFIDSEIKAIKELIGALLESNEENAAERLKVSIELLKVEKSRIKVLLRGKTQNFESDANTIISNLLEHIRTRSRGQVESVV
ncbi:hypothetical protein K3722_04655 [Leisingera caerulea]|uniref:Nucleotidyltransferase n=1 Tax=Leisingera caerulea TaxID=506591 RepID=A0ABY5WYL3_LEICA|nr:hypothetical protein [Leisingera caerulea]UWQ59422.1 hypothetical protein K3722_04655 [Leisingera caerulea]